MQSTKLVVEKDCSWSYIGETGRCFETRKNEHIRNVKQNTAGSNIAKHSWANDHTINFEDGQVIDRGNYRTRTNIRVVAHSSYSRIGQ